jgi:hypothetical protein
MLRFVSAGIRSTLLRIIGGVAAGGGGFGITPSGHITPIPPPTPVELSAESVETTLREGLEKAVEDVSRSIERRRGRDIER